MANENLTAKFGYYTSILLTLFAIITFGIAACSPPVSGPYCKGGCVDYPFTDIISRFPRDYLWMYPAIIMNFVFVALMVCLHQNAPAEKKLYSRLGFSFALMSAAILNVDYFIQISVIQPSLLNGETDGIAMLTQYNPHGIFIALEEIGYIAMSIAFLCIAPLFSRKIKQEKAIYWVLTLGFILTILALIFYSCVYGLMREYRFEVAIITIDFVTLIVFGILLSRLFRRKMKI